MTLRRKFSITGSLGIIAIIGSPWMLIDFVHNGLYDRFIATSTSGVRNSLFMIGWISSTLGLYRLRAMGNKRWQKSIVVTQLILLLLGLCWCVFEIIAPDSPSPVFYYLNFTWPLAGVFMVVTGIIIIGAKKLRGWKRYMPFLAGLWFPQTILINLIDRNSVISLILSGIYATITFCLLGFVLIVIEHESSMKNKVIYKA